jgi:CBS domain-containing protein
MRGAAAIASAVPADLRRYAQVATGYAKGDHDAKEADMATTVNEVMTHDPRTISKDDTLADAAKHMKDGDVGAVLVEDGGKLAGIVTDRDIVVRAVAEGANAGTTQLGEIVSENVETVTPGTSIDDAVTIMRMKAVRRLPVVDDNGRPIGIVSIGDLAIERDSDSALADISAAEPNT